MAFATINLNVDVNSCLSGLWASLRLGKPKSGMKKLEKEMRRLRSKRDDIKKQIGEAEREGKIPTDEVNQWLREVEELEGQVADINQDFQSMSCLSCNCFNQTGGTSSQTHQAGDQVPFRESSNCCSIIRRVVKKLDEANELMTRAGALDPIAIVGTPEPTVMLPISHRPPIGIESYVEDIVSYIDGAEGNIIGIHGMGGIGKTTMLKRIQQHYYNHRIFDHVIWIVASKDYQLKRLQIDIADSLGLKTLQESDNEPTCGTKLFSYLKNRNCLLLLDDIWEHLDLQLLGMAHSTTERGQQSRKAVVFTTRSETVCARMKAEKKIKVNCLDSEKAWQLFKENSDGDVLNSDRGINSCAQELAKECAGLPLALITIARAMLGKKSLEVWNDVLRQIRDEHKWTGIDLLEEDSVIMYKAFKLSYDSLKNDSIRECLLCCALWPEDYEINKFEELIPHWIGSGLIRKFKVINEAFAKGCYYLEVLMDASLLEHSSRGECYYEARHVKMHDVIRDMALLMISKLKGNGRKWLVKAKIIGLHNFPTQEEWQEAERALMLVQNRILSLPLPEYETSTFPKLSMLIIRCSHYHQLSIPLSLLARMPHFTYLDHRLGISLSLLARMPHLTYLDLSGCLITEFPMRICRLTELQYLNLSETGIRSIPLEFGCLCKLEYLLLRSNFINTIPNGAISNLIMLKWLDIGGLFPVDDLWLNELKCFKGHHQLSLGIAIDPAKLYTLGMLPNVSVLNLTLFRYSSRRILFKSMGEDDLGTLQWSRRVCDNLENLEISFAQGVILTMNAGVGCESRFRCLKTLTFHRIEQVEKIRLNGAEFNNLRDLYITECRELKDVSWVLELPCLNLLHIATCGEMEELISNVGNSHSSFGIKMLILMNMDKLHRIADQPLYFPSLEYIVVLNCPRLNKLPFGAEILKSRILKEIKGEQTWWDNLDWDDESNKDSFTPYFRKKKYY